MERKVHEIDATDISLGRLATRVATLLIGKGKTTYVPHIDSGDSVKVKNIKDVKITGNKMSQKVYRHHTFHPGGLKEIVMSELYKKDPSLLLVKAVSRMLPKNKHRKNYLMRLTVE
ncbi:MAG: 50S ribosomal protein L13 [bacterium]